MRTRPADGFSAERGTMRPTAQTETLRHSTAISAPEHGTD